MFLVELQYSEFFPNVNEKEAPRFFVHEDYDWAILGARAQSELFGKGRMRIVECAYEDIPDLISDIFHANQPDLS